MHMRPTQFAPQFTYNNQLLGAASRRVRCRARRVANSLGAATDDITGPKQSISPPQPKADAPWYERLTNQLPGAVTAYTQYKLTKMNLDRAKKGLAPIDSAAYAPTVRVQAELDPQIKQALFIGGGVIAAAAIFAALK